MKKIIIFFVLILFINPAFTYAVTRVFVQNNTTESYLVNSTQSGYYLANSKWQQTSTQIMPGSRSQVLWFNRDDGIKNGKRFYFTTRLSIGNNDIILKQQLKGSTINSHMWQSVEVPGITQQWYDDRKTHSTTFSLKGRFTVKYRAYATGTDDNIEYILQHPIHISKGKGEFINVLAYNIYMRPMSMFKNGQPIRVPKIANSILKNYFDVVVFSEAFDDDIRENLVRRLQKTYPYRSRILGSDRGTEQDGGVIIVSRWPIDIEKMDQRLFKDTCYGSDCLADKGVLYVCIKKEGRRYHIFGSHTQADNSSEDLAMRKMQFAIIKKFIRDKDIPSNEAVIIAGDLNVNMHRSEEYKDMLKELNAVHPLRKEHLNTFDPGINDLAAGGNPEYLDYVLYSKDHLNPTGSYNWPLLLRSRTEWKEFPWETAMWDISDHYPVLGHFEFSAPSKVRAEAPPALDRDRRNYYCRQYADRALQQRVERIERTGSAPANDPVWSADWKLHYNWCMNHARTGQPEAGTKNRQDWLDQYVPTTPDASGGGISQMTMEFNTNRPGMDYRNFPLDTPDPELCRDVCANDPDCQAYTYVKPGIQGDQARCWLKKVVPGEQSDNCCVSGVKKPE